MTADHRDLDDLMTFGTEKPDRWVADQRAKGLTEREISMSHTINNLATDLATGKRVVRTQLTLLEDAAHAVTHGSTNTAAEFIDRAVTSLADWLNGD